METIITETSLWDLLSEPWNGLHLPRFCLFLFLALLFEIYCDIKKFSLACAFSTVVLQLLTGIAGVTALYFMGTTTFTTGERVLIPLWYYPATGILFFIPVVLFLRGARELFAERFRLNGVIRGIIFCLTMYFSITVIATPHEINIILERFENERQNQQVDPLVTTPVDEGKAQGTQGHP